MERDVNIIQISFEHDQRKENTNSFYFIFIIL